jgi:hypothetical protein
MGAKHRKAKTLRWHVVNQSKSSSKPDIERRWWLAALPHSPREELWKNQGPSFVQCKLQEARMFFQEHWFPVSQVFVYVLYILYIYTAISARDQTTSTTASPGLPLVGSRIDKRSAICDLPKQTASIIMYAGWRDIFMLFELRCTCSCIPA